MLENPVDFRSVTHGFWCDMLNISPTYLLQKKARLEFLHGYNKNQHDTLERLSGLVLSTTWQFQASIQWFLFISSTYSSFLGSKLPHDAGRLSPLLEYILTIVLGVLFICVSLLVVCQNPKIPSFPTGLMDWVLVEKIGPFRKEMCSAQLTRSINFSQQNPQETLRLALLFGAHLLTLDLKDAPGVGC